MYIIDNKNFFIKKNSTFPILTYSLTQKIMEKYGITSEMMENVALTFSMIDSDNGLYKIANVPADLIVNEDISKFPSKCKYNLTYQFKESNTTKTGRFYGEFKLDFIDSNGHNYAKMTLPIEDKINITISDSITKTTKI